MFILSFVLEDWAIYDLVQSPRQRIVALLLVSSSYVTWTYQTHTFSNSIETLVVLWSVVMAQRILDNKVGLPILRQVEPQLTCPSIDLRFSLRRCLVHWLPLASSTALHSQPSSFQQASTSFRISSGSRSPSSSSARLSSSPPPPPSPWTRPSTIPRQTLCFTCSAPNQSSLHLTPSSTTPQPPTSPCTASIHPTSTSFHPFRNSSVPPFFSSGTCRDLLFRFCRRSRQPSSFPGFRIKSPASSCPQFH